MPFKTLMLIIGIPFLLIFIWGPIFFFIKKRSRELSRCLISSCKASGEKMLFNPQACLYRGADFKYSKIKGNGVICATEKRIIFHKLIGGEIEIPLSEIEKISQEKWFKGKPAYATGAQYHLVIHTKDSNRIGFLIKDTEIWKDTLEPKICFY